MPNRPLLYQYSANQAEEDATDFCKKTAKDNQQMLSFIVNQAQADPLERAGVALFNLFFNLLKMMNKSLKTRYPGLGVETNQIASEDVPLLPQNEEDGRNSFEEYHRRKSGLGFPI